MIRGIFLLSLFACGAWGICNEDEIECFDQYSSSTYCQQMFYLSPNDASVNCTNFCMGQCGEDQMSCPGGVDMNGCTHPEMCQDMTVWGWFGQECDRMGCDPECGEDQHLCDAGYDMDGCPLPMECKPAKSTYYDPYTMTETECWPGCPTVCGFDEMTCPGAYDGCVENVNCVSKSVWGFDGQECERESCDPECLPDEHLCDMGYNFDTGCPNPMECRSGTGWDMATESEFPCASVCPTVCGPNQMSCDTTDENGCLVPGPCVDNFWDSPMGDSTCTGFCPMDCGMDMMHCPGGYDEYGCEMPGTCMMMEDGCPSEYM